MIDWLDQHRKQIKKERNLEKRRIEQQMLVDMKNKHDQEREEKIRQAEKILQDLIKG